MTTKNELFEKIEAQKEKLWEMADFIFDHPEYRGKEYQACDLLTKYLTDNGFSVEKSVVDMRLPSVQSGNMGKAVL